MLHYGLRLIHTWHVRHALLMLPSYLLTWLLTHVWLDLRRHYWASICGTAQSCVHLFDEAFKLVVVKLGAIDSRGPLTIGRASALQACVWNGVTTARKARPWVELWQRCLPSHLAALIVDHCIVSIAQDGLEVCILVHHIDLSTVKGEPYLWDLTDVFILRPTSLVPSLGWQLMIVSRGFVTEGCGRHGLAYASWPVCSWSIDQLWDINSRSLCKLMLLMLPLHLLSPLVLYLQVNDLLHRHWWLSLTIVCLVCVRMLLILNPLEFLLDVKVLLLVLL